MSTANTYYPVVETHAIRSRYVSQTFKVQVMRPAQKRGETVRFPVVYATDANLAFEMLKGISQILHSSATEAPRFILVGIGYPSDSPFGGTVLRARDLTFPGYPNLPVERPEIEDVPLAEPGTKDFHGAEDFRSFIEHELISFIDQRYATTPRDRTYFGHSGGGGFGIYALFTRPELFRNYIVSSPGLGYELEGTGKDAEEAREFAFRYAQRFAASGRSLYGTKLYLSAGAEEEFEPVYARWHITANVCRMGEYLKGERIPGLTLRTEIFAGETHLSVWPLAFIHGIKAVFDLGAQ